MSTINQERIAEDRAYQQWENEKKNNILKMTNPEKKQEKWNELFPVIELDLDWMNNAKYF